MSAPLPVTARRLAVLSALAGSLSLITSALIEPTVDAQGVLHEPFFLIPLGLFLLMFGVLLGIIARLLRVRAPRKDDQITKKGACEGDG